MTTYTVIPVRFNCDFDSLFVTTEVDSAKKKLSKVLFREYQTPFMHQLVSEVENAANGSDSYVPTIDDVCDWIDSKYSDYMNACDQWFARIGFEDYDSNVTIPVSVPLDFEQIKCRLRAKADKTAYEYIRSTYKQTTKEKLMRLISDRIQPNSTPTMDDIANILISVSEKYLGNRIGWF